MWGRRVGLDASSPLPVPLAEKALPFPTAACVFLRVCSPFLCFCYLLEMYLMLK